MTRPWQAQPERAIATEADWRRVAQWLAELGREQRKAELNALIGRAEREPALRGWVMWVLELLDSWNANPWR